MPTIYIHNRDVYICSVLTCVHVYIEIQWAIVRRCYCVFLMNLSSHIELYVKEKGQQRVTNIYAVIIYTQRRRYITIYVYKRRVYSAISLPKRGFRSFSPVYGINKTRLYICPSGTSRALDKRYNTAAVAPLPISL